MILAVFRQNRVHLRILAPGHLGNVATMAGLWRQYLIWSVGIDPMTTSPPIAMSLSITSSAVSSEESNPNHIFSHCLWWCHQFAFLYFRYTFGEHNRWERRLLTAWQDGDVIDLIRWRRFKTRFVQFVSVVLKLGPRPLWGPQSGCGIVIDSLCLIQAQQMHPSHWTVQCACKFDKWILLCFACSSWSSTHSILC